MLDAALAAGVKKLVVTESFVSLAVSQDFWKDITINEMCECTKNAEGKDSVADL